MLLWCMSPVVARSGIPTCEAKSAFGDRADLTWKPADFSYDP
jgi:hypothetical protein